jgi:hypothetical protein
MTIRVKWLISILLSTVFCALTHASCTGSSPTWNSTPDQASVNTCISNASSGDTINISTGSATWSSGVTISGKGVKLQGAGAGRIIAYFTTASALVPANGTLSQTITSTSAVNILATTSDLGSKISNGQTLLVYELGYTNNFMQGTVASFNSSTGALVMNITSSGGSCPASNSSNGFMPSNCKRWLVTTLPSTTITDTATGNMLDVTEDSSVHTTISGIKFIRGAVSKSNGTAIIKLNRAANGRAILIHDNWFQHGVNSSGGLPLIWSVTDRGVMWNNSFDTTPPAASNRAAFFIKDDNNGMPTTWTTVSTMGTADAAGSAFCPTCAAGENNFYVENNDVHAYQIWNDDDNNARDVIRYNLFNNAGNGSHGADTSNYGIRHTEFYNNVGVFQGYSDGSTANMLGWFFLRGGTMAYHDNVLQAISSQDYGTRGDLDLVIENLSRNAGGHPCWGTGSSGGQYYPVPRQIGMGRVTGNGSTRGPQSSCSYAPANCSGNFFGPASQDSFTYVGDSEPIYAWNNSRSVGSANTALTLSWGSDNAQCGTEDTQQNYAQSGRDYFNTASTAKPGYAPYTYPHPLTQGSSSTGSAPASPSGLHAVAN